MNECFEKNCEAMKTFRPDLFERLQKEMGYFREKPEGYNGSRYHLIRTGSHVNLQIEDVKTHARSFYHAEDPLAEAQQVFERADLKHPQIVFFFGSGLGYMPQIFFQNRPQKNYWMAIVEKDPQVFLRALCLHDFRPLFEEASVHFYVGTQLPSFQAEMARQFQIFSTVSSYLKILGTPSELARYPDYYQRAAEIMMSARDRAVFSGGNSIEDSFIGFQNIIGNIKYAVRSRGLKPLINQFQGQTILSVGAGPDLERHWDVIEKYHGKIPMIVCDTLLKTFVDRGLEPDFITAIERVPVVATFFEGVKIPKRTRLVGPLLLMPEAIEAFQGGRILYCPTLQNAKGLGFDRLGVYFPGSSAGNLNIGFACQLGFSKIIMVGHNCAFGLNSLTSHAKGTGIKSQDDEMSLKEIQQKSGGIKFKTQDGLDEVYSTIWWKSFLHQIEDTIGAYPKTRFINTAPKGAHIEGAELMDLEEAILQCQPTPLDISEKINELIPELPEDIVRSYEDEAIGHLKDQRERIQFWLEKSQELEAQIKKWRAKIESREIEGKYVSLDFLNERIDEVLKVKVTAVNQDQVFYNAAMTTLLPGHLALERELNQMPGRYDDNYKLKRDFLLKHEHYFQVWNAWLPRFRDCIDDYLENSI